MNATVAHASHPLPARPITATTAVPEFEPTRGPRTGDAYACHDGVQIITRTRPAPVLYRMCQVHYAAGDAQTDDADKDKSNDPKVPPPPLAHDEVYVAWQCAQQLRAAYQARDLTEGRRIAEKVLAAFPSCPIPEVARLGRTLKQWRAAFLAYFTTERSTNGGTEAVNGLIELHRRIARGFTNRDNYRLRMLLIGGGLTSPHLK